MSFVFPQNQSNFLHRGKLSNSSLQYNYVSLFSYPRKTVNSQLRVLSRHHQSVSFVKTERCETKTLSDQDLQVFISLWFLLCKCIILFGVVLIQGREVRDENVFLRLLCFDVYSRHFVKRGLICEPLTSNSGVGGAQG